VLQEQEVYMKRAAYFLLVTVAFSFSYTYAGLPQDEEKVLPFISKTDCLLANVQPLCVVVVSHNNEPNRYNLLLKNLKRKTEADLKKAGIDTIVVPDENNPPELPELRIALDIFRPKHSDRYFLHIQTSLAKLVYLQKDLSLSIKTDIWKISPEMEVCSYENLQDMSSRIVSKQVDVFIHACATADSTIKSSTANGPAVIPPKLEKSEAAKEIFVASKNGKVFHKSSCRSVARITPENLVTYKTRDEACAAGKYPCKQCKP